MQGYVVWRSRGGQTFSFWLVAHEAHMRLGVIWHQTSWSTIHPNFPRKILPLGWGKEREKGRTPSSYYGPVKGKCYRNQLKGPPPEAPGDHNTNCSQWHPYTPPTYCNFSLPPRPSKRDFPDRRKCGGRVVVSPLGDGHTGGRRRQPIVRGSAQQPHSRSWEGGKGPRGLERPGRAPQSQLNFKGFLPITGEGVGTCRRSLGL